MNRIRLGAFVRNLSLSYKLGIIPLAFFFLGFINFIVISNFKSSHLSDNEVVNLAGRQRMLSQRIAFYAERISKGDRSVISEYTDFITLCHKSLIVLEKGGIPPGLSENPIPPSSSSVIRELSKAKSLWTTYMRNAKGLLNDPSKITNIEATAQEMLVTFNDLVKAYVEANNKKHAFLDYLLIALLFTNIGLVVGMFFYVRKGIVFPIQNMTLKIKELALGKTSVYSRYDSDDEIGQTFQSLNSLSKGFSAMSFFAQEISNGNLESDYQLLSDEDELGFSLISMRDKLKSIIVNSNRVLVTIAEKGLLTTRMHIADEEGAWFNLTRSINALLDSLSLPIKEMNHVLTDVSEGNLTTRYEKESHGEFLVLSENLNATLDKLQGLLLEIANNSQVISESSVDMQVSSEEMKISMGEIASAISEMNGGAQSQMVKIDASSRLVETMLSSTQDMAAKSNSINESALRNLSDSKNGEEVIGKLSNSIDEMADVAISTNESMRQLSTKSGEITQVLSVITEIASQTNLLALNAAIEAAQAGDAGRGFAVVAEEIRKLAEDSRKSAEEIEQNIRELSGDTRNTAQMMDEMAKSIETSASDSQEASTVFKQITSSSSNTLKQSEDILQISNAQSEKIQEVVNIVESIVVVAEQTSVGTEQISASAAELSSGMNTYNEKSERLKDIAKRLKDWVDHFKLGAVGR